MGTNLEKTLNAQNKPDSVKTFSSAADDAANSIPAKGVNS